MKDTIRVRQLVLFTYRSDPIFEFGMTSPGYFLRPGEYGNFDSGVRSNVASSVEEYLLFMYKINIGWFTIFNEDLNVWDTYDT